MKEWLQTQVENGFVDLEGLAITARVPIKDRLVNQLLAEMLQSASTNVREPQTQTSEGRGVEMRDLLPLVRKAEIHTSDGVIMVDVQIAR